ncbi:H/ACA ribonucleoprotein complex subunit 1 [Armadillidium vulgare]|nr:H/ACA ribonucleoprotein complex subunit 1 [Armadillidium vulgare]
MSKKHALLYSCGEGFVPVRRQLEAANHNPALFHQTKIQWPYRYISTWIHLKKSLVPISVTVRKEIRRKSILTLSLSRIDELNGISIQCPSRDKSLSEELFKCLLRTNTHFTIRRIGRGGFGGGNRGFDQGPPERVVDFALFTHTCQQDLVCKVTHDDVPYFNAPLYFENKQKIGIVDEVFGGINDKYISVKLDQGVKAASFSSGTKLFIDPYKLLPLSRFLDNGGRGGGRGGGGRGRGGGGRGRGGGGRGRFGGGRGCFLRNSKEFR